MEGGLDALILNMLQGAGVGRTVSDFQQQNAQTAQAQQQVKIGDAQLAVAAREQSEEARFQDAVQDYYKDPKPEKLIRMQVAFPKHAEALKAPYAALDAEQRTNAQTVFGSLHSAAMNGRKDLVRTQLQGIQAAERAQGIDTSEIDDALVGLATDDPGIMRQIQGFAQMHLAATDSAKFAATYGAIDKGSDGFTLGKSRYDATGKLIASEPDFRIVRPEDKLVQVGGMPGTGSVDASYATPGADTRAGAGDIVARMVPITLGSEGGGTLADPLTSPKGAKGPMQVLDGTNLDPGFGVAPAADSSQEERARVGRDYLGAMVQRYGNPAQAWAAYNAGPATVDEAIQNNGGRWLQALPAETRRYVAKNMSALGQAAPGAPTGGARVIAEGGPRPSYRTLAPAEVAKHPNLDQSRAYQISPTGRIVPIGSQPRTKAAGADGRPPSTLAAIIAPILAKVAAGKPVTPGEQRALDFYHAGKRKPESSSGIVAVNTPAKAAKLPSGTVFKTPDGQVKVRP
jgi:hypothetical protein